MSGIKREPTTSSIDEHMPDEARALLDEFEARMDSSVES